MQPEQPYQQPPSQYDFFMNNNAPGNYGGGGGGSSKKRLLVVAVGAVILVVLAFIVMTILGNAGKENANAVLSAVQKQQELIRVSEKGVKSARGAEAANLAITAKLSLTTSQQQLIRAVSGKFSEEELSQAKKGDTDSRLTAAEQASRFDEVFLEIMRDGLAELETTLQTAHQAAQSEKTKTALSNSYDQARILLNEPVATTE